MNSRGSNSNKSKRGRLPILKPDGGKVCRRFDFNSYKQEYERKKAIRRNETPEEQEARFKANVTKCIHILIMAIAGLHVIGAIGCCIGLLSMTEMGVTFSFAVATVFILMDLGLIFGFCGFICLVITSRWLLELINEED